MKEKKYCTYCGKENEKNKKLCKKCLRSLEPTDHLLKEYIRSKLIGNSEDKLLSAIKNFIRTHLYGVIMTCSIFITVVSVFTNISASKNNYEIVTEKPIVLIEKYNYQGTGLSKEEVVDKYIKAAQTNDSKTIKSLQLKTFHKDIYNELINMESASSKTMAKTFHFIKNKDTYLKDLKGNYQISTYQYDEKIKNFGNYQVESILVMFDYCSYNNCPIYDGKEAPDYQEVEDFQVIKIDNNYYILGEITGPFLNIFDAISHRTFMNANGDTTNLYFNNSDFEIFMSCADTNGIEIPMTEEKFNQECLKKIGYDNLFEGE